MQAKGATMKQRNLLSLCAIAALGLTVLSGSAIAQATDMDGVKAASNAFYTALMANDRGEAMKEVWAHTPYVTYVGPRSKAITVGWDNLSKNWEESETRFSQIDVTLSDQHIHVNGNLAWEMGQESGTLRLTDGREGKIDFLVTNVYEKLDGRWLIVSHHVQPKPQ